MLPADPMRLNDHRAVDVDVCIDSCNRCSRRHIDRNVHRTKIRMTAAAAVAPGCSAPGLGAPHHGDIHTRGAGRRASEGGRVDAALSTSKTAPFAGSAAAADPRCRRQPAPEFAADHGSSRGGCRARLRLGGPGSTVVDQRFTSKTDQLTPNVDAFCPSRTARFVIADRRCAALVQANLRARAHRIGDRIGDRGVDRGQLTRGGTRTAAARDDEATITDFTATILIRDERRICAGWDDAPPRRLSSSPIRGTRPQPRSVAARGRAPSLQQLNDRAPCGLVHRADPRAAHRTNARLVVGTTDEFSVARPRCTISHGLVNKHSLRGVTATRRHAVIVTDALIGRRGDRTGKRGCHPCAARDTCDRESA